MVCAVCNKESNNRRVCPYCFTPYPPNAPQSRPSTGTARQPGAGRPSSTGMKAQPAPAGNDLAADVRAFVMRQSPVVRWSALGIVLVLVVWMAIGGGDDGKVTFEAGSVPSDIIAQVWPSPAGSFVAPRNEGLCVGRYRSPAVPSPS